MKIRANKSLAMKNCHGKRRHHRRNSSVKKAAAASKFMLSGIGTDKGSLEILTQTQAPDHAWPEPGPPTTSPSLPPLTSPEKSTVFLDLDETLVHTSATLPNRFDFIVRPIIRGTEMTFYVIKRPGVDQFLQKLAEKYEVVAFTAGMREYASLVLDRLDSQGFISHRLYRDSCKEVYGKFVKDLSGLGRDLRRVVIVDDNPNSYFLQPDNGIPVRPFVYDDMEDWELGRLLKFFEGEGSEDIRDAVREYVNDEGWITVDDDDDDDDDDSGGSDDDDEEEEEEKELEKGNGSRKFTNVPVLTTVNSSTPCCLISLHEYYPTEKPAAMEYWIKIVILSIVILIIMNVILCLELAFWKP
ncbi:PREDICTED: CTD small phosphatase-like protein [Fragaria vesca subsp. vesca]|uniref:CTD small phosphatase-like protein n=1 Tax=Fragaria vesca subsp. vesca TaxID=101020 RepID=UPI0002C372B9|nr:PREDICTED: CTD small phosphatase-like protein [Fragaria vesca subsp. vesca]